jgi:hypothetical protein
MLDQCPGNGLDGWRAWIKLEWKELCPKVEVQLMENDEGYWLKGVRVTPERRKLTIRRH